MAEQSIPSPKTKTAIIHAMGTLHPTSNQSGVFMRAVTELNTATWRVLDGYIPDGSEVAGRQEQFVRTALSLDAPRHRWTSRGDLGQLFRAEAIHLAALSSVLPKDQATPYMKGAAKAVADGQLTGVEVALMRRQVARDYTGVEKRTGLLNATVIIEAQGLLAAAGIRANPDPEFPTDYNILNRTSRDTYLKARVAEMVANIPNKTLREYVAQQIIASEQAQVDAVLHPMWSKRSHNKQIKALQEIAVALIGYLGNGKVEVINEAYKAILGNDYTTARALFSEEDDERTATALYERIKKRQPKEFHRTRMGRRQNFDAAQATAPLAALPSDGVAAPNGAHPEPAEAATI